MPSTVIRHLSYEVDRRELTVTFVSGRRYRYFGVAPQTYLDFQNAPSRGAFFNRIIRDHYSCAELTLPLRAHRHRRGGGG